MNISILLSIGVLLAIFVVISWIIPNFPRLVGAILGKLWQGFRAGVIVVAIIAATIIVLLLNGMIASVSLLGSFLFLLMVGGTYLAVHFREEIITWLNDHGIRQTMLIAIIGILIAIALIVTGAVLGREVIAGICFLLVIILTLLLWLPVGLFLRLFRINRAVIPTWLRMAIAFLAFISFFGLLYPGVMTVKLGLVVVFIGIILFATATHSSALRGSITTMTLVMCVLAVWEYASPNTYIVIKDWVDISSESLGADIQRQNIENKVQASESYGVLLQDIGMLYSAKFNSVDGSIEALDDVVVSYKEGTKFLVYDHKKKPAMFGGQSFIRIVLPRANGSFVNSRDLWIEAIKLSIISPADLLVDDKKTKKDDQTASATSSPAANPESSSPQIGSQAPRIIRESGVYTFDLKAGESTGFIGFEDKKIADVNYFSTNNDHILNYDDGTSYGYFDKVPVKKHCRVSIFSKSDQRVTMDVKYRQPAANQTAGL
ncbi:MAG: hypothetical protein WC456_01610 [Patescibacteria group bacterium]